MVRTDNYKLVAFHGQKCGEFYDLVRDPNETRNLWCDPQYFGARLELYQTLCDRMAWTVDPLPVRQGPY